jgi:SAM-dependent methyltransferase
MTKNRLYWNDIADEYQNITKISCDDFHFGPLLPGDSILQILPFDMKYKKCLELGCGAGQNSIFLSKKGGECTAVDISDKQIEYAKKLSKKNNVSIDLICSSMENLKIEEKGFDFIHSVYALPFSDKPEDFFLAASKNLDKKGVFLFSTVHPLMQAEELELDGEIGVFLNDYFDLPVDIRCDENGNELIRSTAYSFSTLSKWINEAGMLITRIFEPYTDSDEIKNSPYYSEAWLEYAPKFRRIPSSIIMLCIKA